MARRTKDWNEGLAEDLRNPKFASQFLIASIEEGIPLQLALAKTIRAMGVTEFSRKAKMAAPNVLRAIDARHNPTQETLNRLLRPFGLVLTVGPLRQTRKKAA